RAPPPQRDRPMWGGTVPVPAAVVTAVVLFGGSAAVSVRADWRLTAVIGVYVLAQLGYCFGLKHQPVVDLAIIAFGFLLRAIAGGVAAGLLLSQWFLLVMAFGSLFMVAGKRYAEIVLVERTGAEIRVSLRKYS